MKYILTLVVILGLILVGCGPAPSQPSTQPATEVADTQETKPAETVQEENTEERVVKGTDAEDFCIAGGKYIHEDPRGSINADIEGLVQFKGKEYCKAQTKIESESPAGTIVSVFTYYYDATQKDFWVTSDITNPMRPEASGYEEMHFIEGVLQE